mgnify:CR=1 FL=1
MKSFQQYITEKPAKLSATFPYKGAEWKDFRGLENPTEREIITLMKKAKFKEVRWVSDAKGKMWAWDADDALHGAVIFAQTGIEPDVGDKRYVKGSFKTSNGNIKVIVYNHQTVGSNFALKNKTLKALAKRINSKGEERVYWLEV